MISKCRVSSLSHTLYDENIVLDNYFRASSANSKTRTTSLIVGRDVTTSASVRSGGSVYSASPWQPGLLGYRVVFSISDAGLGGEE